QALHSNPHLSNRRDNSNSAKQGLCPSPTNSTRAHAGEHRMEVRRAVFLMAIVLALWVLPAGCQVDTGIEPSMKSIPQSHLEHRVPTPSAAPEDPCGNRTVTCTKGSSFQDYIVPWLSCLLSFGVSLVP
ncbi:hypothetical protein EJB05_17224, partial [Eragrostis curvula]